MSDLPQIKNERGFTSVNFMLMLLVLVIAVGAISVDLWHLVGEHRAVAGVVDGAAISAAGAVDTEALRSNPPAVQLEPIQAMARACRYLQDNGGVSACPGPEADIVVGVDFVSVTMRRDVNLTLLRVFAGLNPQADTSPVEVVASSTVRIASR